MKVKRKNRHDRIPVPRKQMNHSYVDMPENSGVRSQRADHEVESNMSNAEVQVMAETNRTSKTVNTAKPKGINSKKYYDDYNEATPYQKGIEE